MIKFLLSMLPQFTTEDVCLVEDENGDLYTAFSVEAYNENYDPTPHSVISIKTFSILGIGGLFYHKQMSQVTRWCDYCRNGNKTIPISGGEG